jgi:hypothetical protein
VPYFVRIIPKSPRERLGGAIYGFGMSESQLLERVIRPYERGEPITLQGRTVPAGEIAEITVTKAVDHVGGHPLSQLRTVWSQDRRSAGEWLVKNATDVTDTYVRSQAGRQSAKPERAQPAEETQPGRGGARAEAQLTWLKIPLAVVGAIASLTSLVLAPHWLQGLAAGVVLTAVPLHRRLLQSPPARGAIAIVAAAGALLALVGWKLESTSTGDDQLPTASIVRPTDGAHVPYRVRVAGTSEGIPLESRPWLFVQSNDGDLYPQGGDNGNNVMIDRADQSWCGYAYFGAPDRSSAGKRYVLIVALATHAAERRLEREMLDQPIGQVPHWRSLPAGFTELGDPRVLTRLPRAQTKEQLEEGESC